MKPKGLVSHRVWPWPGTAAASVLAALAGVLRASENVPHAPFAQWAQLPEQGQLIARLTYQESEAYHLWADGEMHRVDWRQGGEHYGIDINQGFFTLQYGLARRWAADLSVGYTTVGWRYFANFNPNGASQSTSGLMDVAFGVRYQLFNEIEAHSRWTPTLTFRAGAVLPGSFDHHFPFAPGLRSAAIAPELLLRKHFGWPGFGFYADGLYRWNRTTGADQYILAAGMFQRLKGWELNAGYRHLQTLAGESVILRPDRTVSYPRAPRENQDAIEAGFSYTTPRRQIQYAFYTRTVLDGNNSDQKFWVGGHVQVPFTLLKPQ